MSFPNEKPTYEDIINGRRRLCELNPEDRTLKMCYAATIFGGGQLKDVPDKYKTNTVYCSSTGTSWNTLPLMFISFPIKEEDPS